jgi:hypothetical protein
MRYINLSNEKKRNAQLIFKSAPSPSKVLMVNVDDNKPLNNKRLLKFSSKNSLQSLLYQFKDTEQLSKELIKNDPEIDLELTGKFLHETDRIFINDREEVVYQIDKSEQVFLPDGTLKEEREPRYLESNIDHEVPVHWTGKMYPKTKIYQKLVFNKKYQLFHINGLTYDFLFEMALKLYNDKSLMMLTAGEDSKQPLVFNDGGKPYRAFLEGRVQDQKYCLILHLTDMELKSVIKEK